MSSLPRTATKVSARKAEDEDLGRAEEENHLPENRDQQAEHDRAECGAEENTPPSRRDGEAPASPLFAHRRAVEQRGGVLPPSPVSENRIAVRPPPWATVAAEPRQETRCPWRVPLW